MYSLRRFLIGRPLPTWRVVQERLPKLLALPIFASDALSSVAYGTEEILLILIVAGTAVLGSPVLLYIAFAIVVLLAIVVTSYRQTIQAYPSGGGAYTVAKENLGDSAGLAAGAALTIDYTLTVAVSIAAGVAAIVSAYPALAPYRVELALAGIAILTLGNLRGVRESGFLFAMPTYLFIASAFGLIAIGTYRLQTAGLSVPTHGTVVTPIHGLTLFLVLRAFSGGCAAMTGTEAISNAIQAFRAPESKNAATTLTVMACILGTMFIGISYLAWQTHVVPIAPDARGYQTVVSQLARATFGTSSFYYVIQTATATILIFAASTSFAGFPRLASIMARDRFLPRQLYNLGDRLVYSNGILLLALMASVLIIVFRGDTHALIPLYAVGVFLSFTLSQAGMAKRFVRLGQRAWHRRAFISGIGALATGVVTVVLAVTKFRDGAVIVVVLIPALVYVFSRIHRHYICLGHELRLTADDKFVARGNTVLVLVESLHRGVLRALTYAKTLSPDVRAVHVDVDAEATLLLEGRWDQWSGGVPLIVLESPRQSLVRPIVAYLETVRHERTDGFVTVVLPEFATTRWWHKLLHAQSGLLLKLLLLFRRGIVTANVRYHLE